MSWSDTRCLYCDGRLPLYRKITNGQFCSAAHRKAYWQEQERLAVERLHQTHSTLRASHPGSAPGMAEPPQARTAPLQLAPPDPAVPHQAGLGHVEALDSGVDLERPWWMPLVNTDQVPSAGFVHKFTAPQPQWSWSRTTNDTEPLAWAAAPVTQIPSIPGRAAAASSTWETASIAGLVEPLAGQFSPVILGSLVKGEIAPVTGALVPLFHFSFDAAPQTAELQPAPEQIADSAPVDEPAPSTQPAPVTEQIPFSEKLFALPSIAARDTAAAAAQIALPAAIPLCPQLPAGLQSAAATGAPALAGLRRLPFGGVPLVHGIWNESLGALDLQAEFGAPQMALTVLAPSPRLKLASGTRYSMESCGDSTVAGEVEPAEFSRTAPEILMPPPSAELSAPSEVAKPREAGLAPLAYTAEPSRPSAEMMPAAGLFVTPQPSSAEPLRPASRLEPMDDKPASDFLLPAEPRRRFLPGMPELPHAAEAAQVWRHAAGFWKHAPRDLKMLVFAIPVLLALALHPSLPKVRVKAPTVAGGIQRDFERNLNDQWMNVKRTVLDRAAIALDEDFRSGLDDWATRGDLDAAWSFDATGFVRPGPLALYRPSLGLTDYQVQFLGLIDKKALSWVARAADFDNYYVVKLVVLKPGPVPTIGLTRYAVIDGKAQDRADAIVPVTARNDMLYRVNLDVRGDDFALAVQGQMVDSWSEPRLKRGGIGFFASRGEESRVRWVQVTHQYDMLGRLCAYLAPYNIPSTNRSW